MLDHISVHVGTSTITVSSNASTRAERPAVHLFDCCHLERGDNCTVSGCWVFVKMNAIADAYTNMGWYPLHRHRHDGDDDYETSRTAHEYGL